MGQSGQLAFRAALYCRVSLVDHYSARQKRDLAAVAEQADYEMIGSIKRLLWA